MSEWCKIWAQRALIINQYTLEALIRSDGYLNNDFRFNVFLLKKRIYRVDERE